MRASQFLIATTKETPADAEIISHQLMLRAGMIRKLASGIYNWLPTGLRVLRKVENIVREEMNAAGAQELLMPAVQPAELWEQSGRWDLYGGELLRVKDRHNRNFCIGPTHEEVITTLARNEIRSYKQLPLNFYQIQTKFRDERRPRFGVMRAREFIMKDAYSFHANKESLQATYELMYATYTKIFERLGLGFAPVEADTGSIGGNTSHEFHVLADSGEDAIAVCEKYNYAANVELAEALTVGADRAEPTANMSELATPNQRSIEDIVSHNNIQIEKTVKTLLVEGAEIKGEKTPVVALVLRGDHELNELKAEKHPMVSSPLRWLTDEEIQTTVNCSAGSIGVVNLSIPVIADRSAANLSDFTCGANKDDYHFTNVNWQRDCAEPEVFDLRTVVEGDICARATDDTSEAATISIKRGIEVGHIFQLGTKYSEAMNATCLDNNGKAISMPMGCYGIGVSRIVAAAIEQNYDENGIIWPEAIAPFEVIIIGIGYTKSEQVKNTCDELYTGLKNLGIDVILDDRKERPGIQFADAELMGIPHHLVVGDRGLERGIIEHKQRKTASSEDINCQGILETIASLFGKSV